MDVRINRTQYLSIRIEKGRGGQKDYDITCFYYIPFDKVNWPTSSFLIGTFFMSLTLVPAYIWRFGLDRFQVALFLVMFFAVGFSITLGYHRLYSHLTFQAHWSVRLFTLIFGAAAFENSVLLWACDISGASQAR